MHGQKNPTLQGGNILIIDDNPTNLRLFQDVLKIRGYTIFSAISGKAALEFVETTPVDLIVLDVRMPVMDGYEVCERLKANEHTHNVPVIFLSAMTESLDKVRAFTVGGVDYITKPFEPEEVLARIETHLSHARLKQHLQELVDKQTSELQQANVQLREEIAERERTEEQILKLSNAIEQTADVIFITDKDGKIEYVNAAFEYVTGFTREEAIGQNPRILKSGEMSEEYYRTLWDAILVGKPVREITVDRRKNGDLFYYDQTITPLRDKTGTTTHFVSTGRDITERMRVQAVLQESEARYRSLFDDSPISLWEADFSAVKQIVDALKEQGVDNFAAYFKQHPNTVKRCWQSLKTLNINRATLDLIGVSTEAEVIQMVVDSPLIDLWQKLLTAFAEGQTDFYMETDYETRHGQTFNLMMRSSIAPRYTDTWSKVFVTITDRTELERARQVMHERERLLAELESEKELREWKSRFFSMMAHDFRNPLAAIRLAANSLQNYFDRMTPTQRMQRVERILQQVDVINDLMEDVLLTEKMGQDNAHYAPQFLDLEAFCQTVFDELSPVLSPTHHLHYLSDGQPVMADFDPDLMRRVIGNLLSNATKYSPADSDVTLDLTRNEACAVLKVRDQGIGIPEADQAQLFEIFHRASNVGTVQGTGLGLAIVKRAVEIHGGSVGVESQENQGTTFTITLPIQVHAERFE
jgi:PAS domain S-box-containing protein